MRQDSALDRRNHMYIVGIRMEKKELRMNETTSLSSWINADSPMILPQNREGRRRHRSDGGIDYISVFDMLNSRCL